MIKFLVSKWVEKKTAMSVVLGALFAFLGFVTSYLLFSNTMFVGIATVLFTVVISMPLISKLFDLEEKLELKKSAFRKHEKVFDFFLYFFIGMFLMFFVISLFSTNYVVSETNLYGASEIVVNTHGIPPPPPMGSETFSIFKNNVYVMIIAFLLSLFYGARSVFLLALNASIFASALVSVIKIKAPIGIVNTFSYIGCNIGVMFFHMVPEVAAYLLAAVAGGVLSKAIIKEKFWSKRFKIVFVDSLYWLVVALLALYVAAVVEVNISKKLFLANVCLGNTYFPWIAGAMFLFIVLLEFFRKNK